MEDRAAERMAENEATYREANERIHTRARELAFEGPIPFICECADDRCRELLRLTFAEYEAVRAEPRRFFVVPGHEAAAGPTDRVLERHEGHVVVEKVGRAGAVAERRAV
jgi:hypothetical protein